jgi:predicted RNA binding protein YcfA (HicA-like mRNA interferase family)
MPPLGLRPLPYRKVVRRLADFGFHPVSQQGSHVKLRHPDGRQAIVPHHARKDLGRGLLRTIVRDAGIDPDEFFAAFR